MNRKDVQKAHNSTQCTVKTILSVCKQYNSKGLLLRFRCAETHQHMKVQLAQISYMVLSTNI